MKIRQFLFLAALVAAFCHDGTSQQAQDSITVKTDIVVTTSSGLNCTLTPSTSAAGSMMRAVCTFGAGTVHDSTTTVPVAAVQGSVFAASMTVGNQSGVIWILTRGAADTWKVTAGSQSKAGTF